MAIGNFCTCSGCMKGRDRLLKEGEPQQRMVDAPLGSSAYVCRHCYLQIQPMIPIGVANRSYWSLMGEADTWCHGPSGNGFHAPNMSSLESGLDYLCMR